jgi:hypothetical protein
LSQHRPCMRLIYAIAYSGQHCVEMPPPGVDLRRARLVSRTGMWPQQRRSCVHQMQFSALSGPAAWIAPLAMSLRSVAASPTNEYACAFPFS